MAEFLDTTGVSYHLKKIINHSKEKLWLISPYLQFSSQLKSSLEDSQRFISEIILVYGKKPNLNPNELEWLQSQSKIKIRFLQELHAKCYVNEKEALVTSMNLITYSQQNNYEMGFYVSKELDETLYNEVVLEAERILRISSETSVLTSELIPVVSEKRSVIKTVTSTTGYCIRTGSAIPFDIKKPFSASGFQKWDEYGNWDYSEKFCHFSGEQSHGDTSRNFPILQKNYKKAKAAFDF